jgi:hypothetical protein
MEYVISRHDYHLERVREIKREAQEEESRQDSFKIFRPVTGLPDLSLPSELSEISTHHKKSVAASCHCEDKFGVEVQKRVTGPLLCKSLLHQTDIWSKSHTSPLAESRRIGSYRHWRACRR